MGTNEIERGGVVDSAPSARTGRPVASDPSVNGYDVMGFVLQLAQTIPMISIGLDSFIPNRWISRVLTMLAVMIIWAATIYLGSRHRRSGMQPGHVRSAGPAAGRDDGS
jgi:hypothetical protein